MAFSNKKGITVASGFKLQAGSPLDARTTVATITERDELVTINAAYAGLPVYVEADKKLYYYNGTAWVAIQSGAGYTHPTTDGNKHLPTVGTTNDGKILVANKSATGLAEWKSKSDLGLDDASSLFTKGTIPVARLPKGALERLHVVADDTARFKLTIEEVQNGDTVKVTATSKMYYVVDDSKLSSEDGYAVYMAGEAASVAWANVSGKPSTMANPNSLIVKLNGGTNEGSNMFTYTGSTAKSINITPAGIGAAAATHTHTKSQITDMPTTMANPNGLIVKLNGGKEEDKTMFTYTGATAKSVDITPAGIGAAAASHKHTKSEITDMPTALPNANALTVTLNGGTTEGTNKFTYTGSAVKSINITAANIGAAASNHTHNYAGSGSAGGSANSAVKLSAPKKISLTGGATGSVSTDLSADASIEVAVDGTKHSHGNANITDIDASKIKTGTIDIARLPQGALERCAVVVDDTARLALTTAQVQTGDTVKVTKTGLMYFVVDDTKLSSEDGYEIYTAGSATSVPWNGVTGKPFTFPPATHTHNYAGSATAGGAATSANKVNNALTISYNGTTAATFDGSAVKSVNITPAGIGAAAKSHTHTISQITDIASAEVAKANYAKTVNAPAGTILMSISNSTNFGAMFGGTWTCIGTLEALVGSNSLTLYVYQKNADAN